MISRLSNQHLSLWLEPDINFPPSQKQACSSHQYPVQYHITSLLSGISLYFLFLLWNKRSICITSMKHIKTYLLFLQTNSCAMAKHRTAAKNDHYISTIIVVIKIGDLCLRKLLPDFYRYHSVMSGGATTF